MSPQSPRSLNATGLNAERDADRELAIVWPLLGRHIAFHRRLVDVTESVKAALLLSQAIYWTRHGRDIAAAAGWFSKTSEQWALETGLTIKEQASARTALRDLAILDERREGLPAKLHFRLRVERLADLLLDGMGSGEAASRIWTDATLATELLGPSLAYHRVLAGRRWRRACGPDALPRAAPYAPPCAPHCEAPGSAVRSISGTGNSGSTVGSRRPPVAISPRRGSGRSPWLARRLG